MLHSPCFPWLGLLLCAEAPGPNDDPDPPVPTTPNILLIVLDDLGTDRLEMYGQASPTEAPFLSAPNLDALAAIGVRFTQAYASPQCSSSRAMILTGRHAFRTGMYNFIEGGKTEVSLPDTEELLPEYLTKSTNWRGSNPNYAFGAFGKWHLIENQPQQPPDYLQEQPPQPPDYCHPIRNGFDVFQGTVGNVNDHYDWDKVTSSEGTPNVCGITPVIGSWDATVTQSDANAWINGLPAAKPWFAYVAFHPPHLPLQVPDPFPSAPPGEPDLDGECQQLGFIPRVVVTQLAALCPPPQPCTTLTTYDQRRPQRIAQLCMIQHVDAEIGRLVWQKDSLGQPIIGVLRPNTCVFVIGDNGSIEQFMEIDSNVPPSTDGNAPFPTGHAKRTIYQLGVRVPLIAAGPNVRQGGVCSTVVSAVDLFDTIAKLVGAKDPAHIQPPGQPVAQDSMDFSYLLKHPLPSNPLPPGIDLRDYAFAESAGLNDPTKVIAAECTSPWGTAPEQYTRMLTDGTYKYIRRRIAGANSPIPDPNCDYCAGLPICQVLREEFYVIAEDPNEQTNLIYDQNYAGLVYSFRRTMRCFGGPADYLSCQL